MIINLIYSRSLVYKVKGGNDSLKVSLRIMFPAAGSQPAQVFLAGKAGDRGAAVLWRIALLSNQPCTLE